MSSTTENIGLTKPDVDDAYDIAVHNNNADIIDEKVTTLDHITGQVTLAVADWDTTDLTQVVSVADITATNTVVVAPAPASHDKYCAAGVRATEQSNGTLTFICDAIPANALTVNLVIMNHI